MWHTGRSERTCRLPACLFINDHKFKECKPFDIGETLNVLSHYTSRICLIKAWTIQLFGRF